MANPRTSHAAAAARSGAKASEARRRNHPLLVIAILGLLLTAYLTLKSGQQGALAFCDAGSGCDIVQSSRYSTLFQVPLAVWGFAAYATLGLAVWQRSRRAIVLVASLGAAISVYLTLVALIDLDATCIWCLASLALWSVAAVLAWRGASALPASLRVTGAGLAGVAVLVLHLHYAGVFDPAAGPEDPYARVVAEALTASGAKFYGASWCPHCQDQKRVFGTAARYLPYVECSPNGPKGPQATECVAQEIRGYPTWIINGNRYPRMLSVKQLGLMSGAKPPAGP